MNNPERNDFMLFKKSLAVITALSLSLSLCACGAKTTSAPKATQKPVATATAKAPSKSIEELTQNKDYITITVKINGEVKEMKGEVYPDLAPETVANFEKLASEGFYKGLIFHRVIPGFMIQGGGYTEDMSERDTASIKGEFDSNGFENPLKHEKGVLSMARTQVPDSASSQFFIMHEVSPHLDGEYAAFGKITEGLEVIDEIATVETTALANGMADVPVEPVVIEDIIYNSEN